MQRTPFFLALGYMVLVAVAVLVLLVGDGALGGVILLVLGFPWTWLLGMAVDAFNPDALASGVLGVTIGVIGATINAMIIYALARMIVMKRTNEAA